MVSSSSIKERPLEDTSDAPRNLLVFGKKKSGWGQLTRAYTHQKEEEADLVFFTDAKATEQGAWIGGFLQSKDGSIISCARKLGTMAFHS